MKILFVVGQFPLLSETFILNQITGLIDSGHEVHIYSTKRIEVSDVSHSDVEKYNLLNRTIYREKIPKGRLPRLFGGLRLACLLALSNPVMVIRALMAAKSGSPSSFMNIINDVKAVLGLPHCDIIHCHFGYHGNRGMLLRQIGALRGKLITTFHAVDLTVRLNQFGQGLYDNLFEKGDLFLPISNRWQRRLVELGCDETKIRVHRMGIDCNRFTFKSRKPQPNGAFKIISVARLVEKKGLEYGIRAIAILKNKYPDVEYTIIGDGPLRIELTRLINELGLIDNVRMMGWKEQHQVVDILERSTIFMAPSVTATDGDQEGIPVVLMEAMAMGLPVVTTHHSGIPELVIDEKTGFLVDERDSEEMARKIELLISNPELIEGFGKEGRKKVENDFNINILNDDLVGTFKEIIHC